MPGRISKNIKKELLIEYRNKSAVTTTSSFAVITTVGISFITRGTVLEPGTQSLLLWVIIYFTSMSGLSHIFTREYDQETVLFLKINYLPYEVYLSKLAVNILFLFGLLLIVIPLFVVLNDLPVSNWFLFLSSLVSGSLAIASASTFLGSLAAVAGGKTAVFTIISFPVILPVLWYSTLVTTQSLYNNSVPGYGNIYFLLAFSIFTIIISTQLFKIVWEN